MMDTYLQVTFRKGRPFAAYYYLERRRRARSHHIKVAAPGLIVDFDRAGRPLGIEILDPRRVKIAKLNSVLRSLGCDGLSRAESNALHAA